MRYDDPNLKPSIPRWLILRNVAIACAALILSACSPTDLVNLTVALNATIGTQGLEINHELTYAAGDRHGLDVYRADAARGARPVVVFFYGGAWQTGKRQDYLFAAAALARQGFLVFVPDYRLYPAVQYPVFLDDAAQAVAYVKRVAPSWGGDPDRLFLVAHSAGAYMAEMLALDPQYLARAGMSPRDLAGVVSMAGPADFLPITGEDIKLVFGAHCEDPATMPINHVDGRNPPLLLLHGDADQTVYPRNSIALAARIRADGGPVELKEYPGVGHIGIVLSFAPLFRDKSTALADTARFVQDTPAISVPTQ